MLVVRNLGKRIGGRQVLAGLSFVLEPGELLLVTGANGAGKTTLLRLLAGVTRPSEGEVHLDGVPLQRARAELRRRVGYVAHAPLLYPNLTGYENLEFYAALYGVPDRPVRIRTALSFWQLERYQDQPVRTYSRGMCQRLALIRATLHQPRLLLLDEPMAGLDQASQERFAQFLAEHRRAGGAAVMTTHDPAHARQLGGKLARLARGRLVMAS